jgi:cytochrome P450
MNDQGPKALREASQLPSPPGYPLLGNAPQLGSGQILRRYEEWWKSYGDLIRLKMGPIDGFIVVRPEHAHQILVSNQKNYIKGIGYDGFRILVGQGLVTSDGDLWRQQRKLMQPPFTPSAVSQYDGMMVEVIDKMLARWQGMSGRGEVLNMDNEMMRLTMSVISRAMFDLDLSEDQVEIGQALQDAFKFTSQRSTNPLSLPLSAPLPANRRFQRDFKLVEDFIQARVAEGRRNTGQKNLLSMLLRAQDDETGNGMSEKQLRDEVITLFFAGFETTARTLTWAWYMIAKHPEVQRQLQAEADRVLAGRGPSSADLPALQYSRCVVDETLRLYPPTALLARQNVIDEDLGGYRIPAKSMIILAVYLLHRYPAYWPDAERFDPERFRPEATASRPKYAYIPFASGPRICLGINFALLEMVYTIAMVAGRYRLSMAAPGDIKAEFVGTMRPERPLLMVAEPRKAAL